MKVVGSNFAAVLLALFSLSLTAETKPIEKVKGLTKSHKTFYDYLTSRDFDCEVTDKKILKPGTLGNSYDLSTATPMCSIVTSCIPKPGIETDTVNAMTACLATDGVCEEPMECAKRRRDESARKVFSGRIINVASTAVSANNRFQDVCWETNGIQDRRGTVQLLSDGKPVEEFCSIVYACRGSKKPKYGSCALRKEGNDDVCPQLNDCINEDLSLVGHSKSDLAVMSAREVDEYFEKYEAGKKLGQQGKH